MPTGYTADLAKGKPVTFSQFVMRCARGMGALATMREDPADAPIPERLEPDLRYYEPRLAAAHERLAWLETLTPAQREEEAEKTWRAEYEVWAEREARKREQAKRYHDMLARLKAWDCKAEGIKEFMISQIEESIRFDISETTPPERETGEAWFNRQVREEHWNIDYHTNHIREEIERTEARNKWLADLRASLPPEDAA